MSDILACMLRAYQHMMSVAEMGFDLSFLAHVIRLKKKRKKEKKSQCCMRNNKKEKRLKWKHRAQLKRLMQMLIAWRCAHTCMAMIL